MAKRFALVVLLVAFCIVFFVPAFAVLGDGSAANRLVVDSNEQLVGNDRDAHGCIPSAGYSWCEAKQKCLRVWEEKCIVIPLKSRVSAIANERLQGLKNDAIAGINQLRKTDFEKIRELKKEELDKLKDLKAADFNNWSQLKKESLEALTNLKQEQIDKIKGLRAVELWKLSNLRQDVRDRLLDLNQELVNRIVSVVPKDSLDKILDLNAETLANVSDLNDEELAVVSQLDKETAKTILSQQKQLVRERLRASAAVTALNKARLNFLRSRERFEFAREKFLDAKQTFLEKKQDFNRLRERIRNRDCNAVDANCSQLREQLKENAQQVLLNQINAILNHLEAIQNKNVDLGDINALIAKFEALRDKLEDENVSEETLIEAAKEIRHSWGQLKQIAQKKILSALNNRLASLIDKSVAAYDKLNAKIAELKQTGKDTNKLEAALAVYKQRIDEAKALHEEATALLAKQDLNSADLVKIWQDVRQASSKLLNAFHLLKRIINAHAWLVAGKVIGAVDAAGIVSEDPEPIPDWLQEQPLADSNLQ